MIICLEVHAPLLWGSATDVLDLPERDPPPHVMAAPAIDYGKVNRMAAAAAVLSASPYWRRRNGSDSWLSSSRRRSSSASS